MAYKRVFTSKHPVHPDVHQRTFLFSEKKLFAIQSIGPLVQFSFPFSYYCPSFHFRINAIPEKVYDSFQQQKTSQYPEGLALERTLPPKLKNLKFKKKLNLDTRSKILYL